MHQEEEHWPSNVWADFAHDLRLSDVLSRISVNYRRLMSADTAPVVAEAIKFCRGCDRTKSCDRWIATHEEGDDNPYPHFCPVIRGLVMMASQRPIDEDVRPSHPL